MGAWPGRRPPGHALPIARFPPALRAVRLHHLGARHTGGYLAADVVEAARLRPACPRPLAHGPVRWAGGWLVRRTIGRPRVRGAARRPRGGLPPACLPAPLPRASGRPTAGDESAWAGARRVVELPTDEAPPPGRRIRADRRSLRPRERPRRSLRAARGPARALEYPTYAPRTTRRPRATGGRRHARPLHAIWPGARVLLELRPPRHLLLPPRGEQPGRPARGRAPRAARRGPRLAPRPSDGIRSRREHRPARPQSLQARHRR